MNRRHFLRAMVASMAAMAVPLPAFDPKTVAINALPFEPLVAKEKATADLIELMIKMVYRLPTLYYAPERTFWRMSPRFYAAYHHQMVQFAGAEMRMFMGIPIRLSQEPVKIPGVELESAMLDAVKKWGIDPATT
jgi:hypothetical protein